MSNEQSPKNPKEILDALNRVSRDIREREALSQVSQPTKLTKGVPAQPIMPSNNPPPSIEVEDHSSDNEGTVFLLWFDNEDAQRFPPGQQSGIYPMKSAFYLSKHVDFHNEVEKQNALQEIAGVVELFENDSPEVKSRGKYAIIIGKMVQVEVQRKIVLK